MDGLDKLPTWLQGIVMISVFGATAVAAVQGYTKKRIAASPEHKPDAVVLSAVMADGPAMRELIQCIRKLTDTVESSIDFSRNNQDVMRMLNQTMRENSERLDASRREMMTPRPTNQQPRDD